jgi:hypothetical protein
MSNIINSPITGGKVKNAGTIPTALIKKNIKACYKMVRSEIAEILSGLSAISILECEDTGYKFYYPFLDAGEAFYNKIGREQQYYSTNRWEFGVALDFICTADKICEIGAGYGYFPDFLRERERERERLNIKELN